MAMVAGSPEEELHWTQIMNRMHEGNIDSWAYPALYMCWAQQQLTILPNENLISNLGYGEDATHTVDATSSRANYPTTSMGPLQHPWFRLRNKDADEYIYTNFFQVKHVRRGIRKKLKSFVSKYLLKRSA